MKLFVSIAALAFAFAAPVFATDTVTTATMTAEECKAALEKCGTDAQCKTDLEVKGCKVAE